MLVGGFNPSEKYESQLGLLFPIYGKVKNVPNHQPVMVMVLMLFYFGWSMTLSEMDHRSSLNIESPVVTHATKLHQKCDISVVLSKPPKRIKKIEKEDPIKLIKSWYFNCPSFLVVDIVSMSAPPEGLHSCLWPCYPHWRRVPWVSGSLGNFLWTHKTTWLTVGFMDFMGNIAVLHGFMGFINVYKPTNITGKKPTEYHNL